MLEDAIRLGLKSESVPKLLQGEYVLYERPTLAGAAIIGLVQDDKPILRSGILSWHDKSGFAPIELGKWRSDTRALAKRLACSNMELFGVAVINRELANLLTRLGFHTEQRSFSPSVDLVGGETLEIMTKLFRV